MKPMSLFRADGWLRNDDVTGRSHTSADNIHCCHGQKWNTCAYTLINIHPIMQQGNDVWCTGCEQACTDAPEESQEETLGRCQPITNIINSHWLSLHLSRKWPHGLHPLLSRGSSNLDRKEPPSAHDLYVTSSGLRSLSVDVVLIQLIDHTISGSRVCVCVWLVLHPEGHQTGFHSPVNLKNALGVSFSSWSLFKISCMKVHVDIEWQADIKTLSHS